ncbi:MAG: metallophosphoesterase [Cyclobacteriaceae bacterium]|nr:metallophosphoesterase [Cyclobacteriaceae bacterium]
MLYLRFLLVFFLLFSVLCLTAQNKPTETAKYRLYLIGDAGTLGSNTVLDLLKNKLFSEEEKAGVIFLGDNIYDNGMPLKGSKSRVEAEKIIDSQISAVKNFKGNIFFIPGNHDWNNGKNNGWQRVKEQEAYIENALDSANVFFPNGGCPGPVEIPLDNNITLVILDTQYFLQKGKKPGRSSSCGAKTPEEAFMQLQDILKRNVYKKVIVASHHPIHTKGMHGGVVTAKDHFFPLTKLNANLWIPLPVIGSVFPLYRQTIGALQDQANLQHKAMIKAINELLITHKNVVHVSGHEHALQYLAKNGVNYVVSGAGSKQNTTVKQKKPSVFAGNYHGYGYLDYYANGEVWLTFESPDTATPIVFEMQISNTPFYKEYLPKDSVQVAIPRGEKIINVTNVFEGSNMRYFVFGKGYRPEWYQKVKAPVFDIGNEKGGLEILKRGGGNQTKSLRLEAANGKQYVIRLLEKDASKLIPDQFKSNFVKKVVQEGITGSHPYAAFVVPPLASAVGVYHTNPKLVFLPDDPKFGIYREDFKNKLALFEERPAKNQSDAPYFGNAKKIISTPDMLAKLYKDNDNKVDQQMVLKARLFDTFLGDWDRHDDQWRWAQFANKGKGKYFEPIPRDRDQVFYVNEGLIPSIIGTNWAVPALQGFGPEIKNVPGLWSFAAKYFDRSFLTELEREDWLETSEKMRSQLTDKIIENAIKQWPGNIYQYHGDKIIANLKLRRDKMGEYALTYYKALAKQVDVVGSNKKEYFEIIRKNNDTTSVKMFKINSKGRYSKLLYHRNFIASETKEIHVYGLDGNDVFKITGNVANGPKIRAIGGAGNDSFTDSSSVKLLQKTWLIYDLKNESNSVNKGKETKNNFSHKPQVNVYNRKAFNYNYLGPLIGIKFNRDDGLFLGAGINFKIQGFRKNPYKSSHKIGLTHAIATSSYNFMYEGEYIDVIKKVDLILKSEIRSPNFVSNYFGLGNQTIYNQTINIDYYRVRFEEILLDAHIKFNLGEQVTFLLGSSSQVIKVEPTAERFVTNFSENGLDSATVFKRKAWTGFSGTLKIDTRNKEILTEKGIEWVSKFGYNIGISDGAGSFGNVSSNFTFYYSFKMPSRVTLSNRTGFAQVFGNYEFYQANYIGGHNQLRGFRQYRFGGNQIIYNNTDIIVKLLNVRAYILPVQIGVNLFYDTGKTAIEGEKSTVWHHGYGAGIWLAPAKVIYMAINLGRSVEGWFPTFQFKFSVN